MAESRGPPRVKNKAAAPTQITAEMLMQEAADHQEERKNAPLTKAADLEEVQEFRQRKRNEFENAARRSPHLLKNWTQYAEFEFGQQEWERGRSIFERAMDNGHQYSVPLWMRYIDSELKGRNINMARNLCERMITLLPRVEKAWYKLIYIEQMTGNADGARRAFKNFLSFHPTREAYMSAIKFEQRYNEMDNARAIWDQLVDQFDEPRTWIRRARWEEEFGTEETTQQVFEEAAAQLDMETAEDNEEFFIAFAKWEIKNEEFERASHIYRKGLDSLPKSKSLKLQSAYTKYQKQHGDQKSVEDVVAARRRDHYRSQLREQPKDVDTWIDLIRLEESAADHDRIVETYEEALGAAQPPATEKRLWRRYIYIGLFYASWCERELQDIARTRNIYKLLIKTVPHKKFTFAKLWLHYAEFEIRQDDFPTAWKTMGRALGECPKPRIFRDYIDLRLKLHDYKGARTIYEKFALFDNTPSSTWVAWAKMEYRYHQLARAREILKIGLAEDLDAPEDVWKAAIELEVAEGEDDKARALYEQLLTRTDHPKVYINYAQFEIDQDPDIGDGEDEDDDANQQASPATVARARAIFERGYRVLRDKGLVDERVQLLTAWNAFEAAQGDDAARANVAKMMPNRVKKRRKLDDGEFEEYLTWVFPMDEGANSKALEMMRKAQAWKKAKE